MSPSDPPTTPGPFGPPANILGISDEQSKAISSTADFGKTVVEEGSQLARYLGRVLGTTPHDTVGLVIGDPLHFVRTLIAHKYDDLLTGILKRRNVTDTQPVSPSVAIPLIRAAYDEGRPELQELWAALIAAAMDPKRSNRIRLSFIETLRQFDPFDTLVLKRRAEFQGQMIPNARDFLANQLHSSSNDAELSIENLIRLNCVIATAAAKENFVITKYGLGLILACSD